MSTRCNIIVRCGATLAYFYRHYDGYLSEIGADLLEKTRSASGTETAYYSDSAAADRFVRALLASKYDGEKKDMYEVTNGLHGDIEHVYEVDFAQRFNTGRVSILHAARPANWYDTSKEVDDWANTRARYSLSDFAKAVNRDRAETNVRIAELRTSSGAYADVRDYPMVAA